MLRRTRNIVKTLALACALVLILAFAVGARPVYAYHELRCDTGYVAHPRGGLMEGVFECEPQRPSGPDWPQVGITQNEVGLYLTNLQVRVFHLDFLTDTYLWFAVGVPFS